MRALFKQISILLLVVLLLSAIAVGAYAASSLLAEGVNAKKSEITIGKNWEIKGSGIRQGDKLPPPPKHPMPVSDPARDKALIDQRPMPSEEALRPVFDIGEGR